mmetsp:Transcript_134486/g.348351  ORF Transcript_134486/g.348351 Transcript_134486/m.348351 type:complete len:213 (-) Transcript_134486:469-1107(-)
MVQHLRHQPQRVDRRNLRPLEEGLHLEPLLSGEVLRRHTEGAEEESLFDHKGFHENALILLLLGPLLPLLLDVLVVGEDLLQDVQESGASRPRQVRLPRIVEDALEDVLLTSADADCSGPRLCLEVEALLPEVGDRPDHVADPQDPIHQSVRPLGLLDSRQDEGHLVLQEDLIIGSFIELVEDRHEVGFGELHLLLHGLPIFADLDAQLCRQ